MGDAIEQRLDAVARLRLCQLPTPIQRLSRLERQLGLGAGPQLYVKRDDLTGLAFGGNKGRKLEFSLAEAQLQGADTILTCGGIQSNHCRQTAIAARALGYEVHLFLLGRRPASPPGMTGNLLPSELVGAQFHFIDPDAGDDLHREMETFAVQLRSAGRRPYLIPTGASNPTGALGYVSAVREIMAQERQLGFVFDWIVCASGSYGTQAGLLAGKKLFGLAARVLGVTVFPLADVFEAQQHVARLATDTAERLSSAVTVGPDEVTLEPHYVGSGYAVPTESGREAIRLLATLEGIFLDPCYTAKAMAGLLDYLRQDKFQPGQRVLFLHTGGNLALFA